VIWLKVAAALVAALASVAVMCLFIRGVLMAGQKALGWLLGRRKVRRAAAADLLKRDDFTLWEAEFVGPLQRLANRIKR
jgi:hypothetical protein